jgi:hypothetical protein
MERDEQNPDFLERLATTGRSTWSSAAPTRLLSVAFTPSGVRGRLLSQFLYREEAEALQLSVVAQSRDLEKERGRGNHVLHVSDTRTFGAAQFLVVEYDSERRPIRANDAWGLFRNNLGAAMTNEYLGSRSVPGGVFSDRSPQSLDASRRDQMIFDLAMLPVGLEARHGTDIKRGVFTDAMMNDNARMMLEVAQKREKEIAIVTTQLAISRLEQTRERKREGPTLGM